MDENLNKISKHVSRTKLGVVAGSVSEILWRVFSEDSVATK